MVKSHPVACLQHNDTRRDQIPERKGFCRPFVVGMHGLICYDSLVGGGTALWF